MVCSGGIMWRVIDACRFFVIKKPNLACLSVQKNIKQGCCGKEKDSTKRKLTANNGYKLFFVTQKRPVK
jgi:hypothetical protein